VTCSIRWAFRGRVEHLVVDPSQSRFLAFFSSFKGRFFLVNFIIALFIIIVFQFIFLLLKNYVVLAGVDFFKAR